MSKAKTFAKDTYVWLADEEEGFIPALVKTTFSPGEKGTVLNLLTDSPYNLSSADSKKCRAMDAQSLAPIQDMVLLKQLDEPSMLHNLRLRYEKDEIYTAIGSILISINPFKKLSIYNPEVVDNYIQNGAKKLPPHIFGTADNAYQNLVSNRASQSCIVSGESGAGKTEATKLFLQYLAEKSSAGDEKAKSGATILHQKILEANPLMEAFGNAKTLRNNNSSRFGKLIQVDFDNKRGKIVGGNITEYLLEKSRIVGQASGERNYHIFYQITTYANMDLEFNKDLKLATASEYFYTNPNDNEDDIGVDGMNDNNEFESTLNAMDVLEFSKADKDGFLGCVAAVLNLGNIEFNAIEEKSEVKESSNAVLARTAELLGVDEYALKDALVRRKIRELFKDHTVEEAISTRDAFAKATYGYMFELLIQKTNKSLMKTGTKVHKTNLSSISVLDIFGFESFEINSFEQLCINYCNEKLQSHFNEHIFKLEQALYLEEGIELSRIEFTDNKPTLDVIEAKPTGILSILDEVNRMPKGSDKVFLEKVLDTVDDVILCRPNVKELRNPKNRLVFIVNHYAGRVDYTVTNFMEKNRDRLLEGLSALGASSKNKFIKSLFADKEDNSVANNRTLGGQFKTQLNDLMITLSATEPHYVRTIKPNDVKAARDYMAPMILDQMRYAGLMEVCRIRKLGYPVRKDFNEFYRRYKALASNLVAVTDHKLLCQDLEKNGIFTAGQYQLGHTKVFMRDQEFDKLENLRGDILGKIAAKIQRIIRGFIMRRRFSKYKGVIASLEAAIQSREISALESALRGIGILPFVGKHLPVVQRCKKVLAEVKEQESVVLLLKSAIQSRDLTSLNSALESAEKWNMKENPSVKEAIIIRDLVIKEQKCIENLETALEKNEASLLQEAVMEANELKLQDSNAYKNAMLSIKHLQDVELTIKGLEKANETKNIEEITKYLTKMAELGKTDHELVKEGQKLTKEMATASAEAEKKIQAIKKSLKQAVAREDLAGLKKLKPQLLKFGITGELVAEANALEKKLEKKAKAFSELSASKNALEIKYNGFEGVSTTDVDRFTSLLISAVGEGFKEEDEELATMKEFEQKMKDQIEAQAFLGRVMKKKEEDQLRKALTLIQELGLRTGLAKEVEQEVQMLDSKLMEDEKENREKEKEELKNKLKEGDEDDLYEEKAAMLEERSEQHKALLAKSADTSKYHFSKYYRIREDGDFVRECEDDVKEVVAERKLKYQATNIPKSLMQFPNELSKTAMQVFKSILQYCGDRANPFPNTMAKFMVVTCLENPILVDEVYLQLMKHLSDNQKPVSEDRGWGLLCMMTLSVPPSKEFAPFVVNFLLQHKKTKGLIGNYAKLCIVQLDGRIRLGPTNLIPDLDIIDTYSERPPILAIVHRVGENLDPMEIPVTPDEDVDKVLLNSIYPKMNIIEEEQFMYGVFVIDGRPEIDIDLRTRLTRFYQKYNPTKAQHIEYFLNTWGDNQEGLFHKLETKYGPEPSEEEVEQAKRKKGQGSKVSVLQFPITAALKAAQRLGLAGGPRKPPPSPQTAWPLPWWVFLGDVFLKMIRQNRVPIFTFKRKLFKVGEPMTTELVEQTKFEVVKGTLAIRDMSDVVDLAAIHLSLRNDAKPPETDQEIQRLGLIDALPITWLATKQPKDFLPLVKEALPKLIGAEKRVLNEKYMQICRNQVGYGMWFFYLSKANSSQIQVAGVDTQGVHILDPTRTSVSQTFKYTTIKEYGAAPTIFWMKVLQKLENKKTVTKVINLHTLQAWDIYGLVYEYTFSAEKLNLK